MNTIAPPLLTTSTREGGATVSSALSAVLFGPEFARDHEPWRALVDDPAFHYRRGLSDRDRAALSYTRLRLVNDVVADPLALAADPARLASLHEWMSVVDGGLATVAGIHYNLFLGSLVDHHDDPRRDLGPVIALRSTGVFLCTEVGHGNDAPNLETTAVFEPATGGFTLNTPSARAQKYMPNTSTVGGPKTAVVAARLVARGVDLGPFLFLAPLSDTEGPLPGIRVTELPERTGNPVDHCLTSFEQVRLPPGALMEAAHGQLAPDGTLTSSLGNPRKRFLRSIARVTPGKLCMSGCGVGATRAALAIAVRYAHHRHIGGARQGEVLPVAAHRSHHAPLIGALATAYAMTFLHRRSVRAWQEHTEDDRAHVEREIAVAKGWITWRTREITTEARERCGARGLFPHNGIALLPQNIDGAITAEGDNLAIWVKSAAEMLFDQGARPGTATPDELPGQDGSAPANLRALLAAAQSIWTARARVRLRAEAYANGQARWNATCLPALEAVGAHASGQAADAFIDAVARTPDQAARLLLEELCRLFLLQQLKPHTGDLLAAGHISPEWVHRLPDATEQSIAALAPHMLTLVDAFELPASYLASVPIANATYQDVDDDPQAHWNTRPTPLGPPT
ncbi:acyl-CoA dehydrogenase [Streptomyces sp. NPDC087917]|uniref:acyl-CoA dehydrogenase n=1 Tax=Streptomyces sp. NPDC087917 TaxID=3155060 RepID=UPI003438497C